MGYTTEINSVILKRVLKRGPSQGGDFGGFNISMFGRTVNPISTRGADYAHHSTTSPLKFSDLATALPWFVILPHNPKIIDLSTCTVY